VTASSATEIGLSWLRVRPAAAVDGERVTDVVHELVATVRALDKLAARGIAAEEPPQLPGSRHVIVHNPRDPLRRRFLIGSTHGGRVLTLVIEQTVEPTTWLIVTGWIATAAERTILSRKR
jgi:hypothetical protein